MADDGLLSPPPAPSSENHGGAYAASTPAWLKDTTSTPAWLKTVSPRARSPTRSVASAALQPVSGSRTNGAAAICPKTGGDATPPWLRKAAAVQLMSKQSDLDEEEVLAVDADGNIAAFVAPAVAPPSFDHAEEEAAAAESSAAVATPLLTQPPAAAAAPPPNATIFLVRKGGVSLGAVKVTDRTRTTVAALRKQIARELSGQLRAAFPRGWLFSLDKGSVPLMRKQESSWSADDLAPAAGAAEAPPPAGGAAPAAAGVARLQLALIDDLAAPPNPLLAAAQTALAWFNNPLPTRTGYALRLQKLMRCSPAAAKMLSDAQRKAAGGGGAAYLTSCARPVVEDPQRTEGPLTDMTSSTRELIAAQGRVAGAIRADERLS